MDKAPQIIYEDENFIAVNKPAGLLVHPTVNSKEKTLVDWLVEKYPEIKNVGDPSAGSGQINLRPGIVHRLDRDTSGVILIARNQKYFEYLKKLFQNHLVQKNYLALVFGKLKNEKGIIEKPISLKAGTTKRTVHGGKMEKEALTEYEVLKTFEFIPARRSLGAGENEKGNVKYFSLVKVSPKTGRTHQIRIHLASIGHSIVGDSLYGAKENPLGLKRQFLHAESLEFATEEGKRMRIEAEQPKDLKSVLKNLEP
ncbi:MAG: RluA family pseudouridine synthase [Patescibacteria group bacterium]